MSTNKNQPSKNEDDGILEPVRGDRLDTLLRGWHAEHTEAAQALRERILHRADAGISAKKRHILARIGISRVAMIAASIVILCSLAVIFVRETEESAFAVGGIAQIAEGGALDALDEEGGLLGPCPLQRTDVVVEIQGPFARTTIEQVYANPYPRTIEAVYTFPLSNRAAVDRMTMVLRGPSGEKIIEGEVKERSIARTMYEDARESGYVASILEQERPNIFTQSVANIEPGATVRIRIATIEMVERRDGVSSYTFPMVVGPRYIPGRPTAVPSLPTGWQVREGVVLRGPARVEAEEGSAISIARMTALLESAIPVRATKNESIDELLALAEGLRFTANYANGSAERGVYFASRGIGEINGRFFVSMLTKDVGTGFANDTASVPDASRITPSPVRPSERAGHDISMRVTIDSGGAAVENVESLLHDVSIEDIKPSQRTITLVDQKSIPNRDFVLHWSANSHTVEPGFFAHVDDSGDASARGGFFAIMLEPPARVEIDDIRPRELIFVLDVSGSMNGFPIEKSKALARKAIARMRAKDTFNVITFAGATSVLWPEPRAATEEARRIADQFVEGAYGSGGTEMMTAINTALVQDGRSGLSPAKLLDLPADGRNVCVAIGPEALVRRGNSWTMKTDLDRSIAIDLAIAIPANPKRLTMLVDGTWSTRDGDRVLVARSARFEDADARTRIVVFLTDGYIGNDQTVLQAVRDNARASRVFSFGIGNSVNRFLLEEMARAGRGACDIVTLQEDADGIIDRLVRRIESPVLTDIEIEVEPRLGVRDLLPAGDHLPDLYDETPIVLLGRFDRAATGSITLRGRTGMGAWERTIEVALPAEEPRHDVVPTLWARAQVDQLLLPHLAAIENQSLDAITKQAVIRLGEAFQIATPFTSFVAVEKSRVTFGGRPMLVAVPVELPDGTNWAGFFGEDGGIAAALCAESRTGESRVLRELGALLSKDAPPVVDVVDSASESAGESSRRHSSTSSGGGAFRPSGGAAPATASAPPQSPMPSQGVVAPGAPVVAGDLTTRGSPPAPSSAPNQREKSQVFGGGFGAGVQRNSFAKPGSVESTNGESKTYSDGSKRKSRGAEAPRVEAAESAVTLRELESGTPPAGRSVTDAPTTAGVDDAALPRSNSEASILTRMTRDQLVRVLERRLALVAIASALRRDDLITGLAAELGLEFETGRLLVAMKVRVDAEGKVDPALLEQLRTLQITLEPAATRGLAVARLTPAQLMQVFGLAGVLRVEPLTGDMAAAR